MTDLEQKKKNFIFFKFHQFRWLKESLHYKDASTKKPSSTEDTNLRKHSVTMAKNGTLVLLDNLRSNTEPNKVGIHNFLSRVLR